MVVAVARHKVPLLSKVVIKASYCEIVVLRNGHIGPERKCVYSIAVSVAGECTAARSRSGKRHIFCPQLLDIGIDADTPGIKCVQVVSCPSAGISQDSKSHVRARYEFGNCL